MKRKTVVVYKSSTGFTERYAQWISEELNCDKVDYKNRKQIRFEDYDTIIYGGGFHAGFINGLKWFKEKMAAVEGKTWVVFGTGASPAEAPEVQNALRQNFTAEEWGKVKAFYMQSGLCYEKMGPGEKFMMAAFRKMLKTSEGESKAYKMMQSSYDYASRDFIAPLVGYCKGEKKSTTLVIMAAGMGSRFGGGIKQLEPVGPNGEIIMDYSIYDAIEAGFDKVVFVTRKDLLDTFKEVIGNRIEKKIPVEYALQEIDSLPEGFSVPEGRTKPWGTGQAILCCKDIVKEPFLVINADDYYGKEAFKLIHDYLVEDHSGNKQYNFCMAGFILGNTLSDNGGVTRGICVVDEKGNLIGVKETGGIVKTETGAACDDGNGNQVPCDINSHVSMNMWGFTPDFFAELETGFQEFLGNLQEGDIKSEYLLPMIVDGLIKEQKANVTVLETRDKWFGVTYKEDKPVVVESIRKLIDEGLYPEK